MEIKIRYNERSKNKFRFLISSVQFTRVSDKQIESQLENGSKHKNLSVSESNGEKKDFNFDNIYCVFNYL